MEFVMLGVAIFPFAVLFLDSPMMYLPLVLAVYLLPLWVALLRRHPNRVAIGLLNVLLGWMSPGWVVALVWASLAKRPAAPDR